MGKAVWQDRFKAIRARLLGMEPASEMLPSLAVVVEEARVEWSAARRYFEIVSDPDLVDQAIFTLQAAEKKYTYLLKLVKTQDAPVLH